MPNWNGGGDTGHRYPSATPTQGSARVARPSASATRGGAASPHGGKAAKPTGRETATGRDNGHGIQKPGPPIALLVALGLGMLGLLGFVAYKLLT